MFGRTYVIKRARGELFFSKKHDFLGLTQVYSENTALSKHLKLQSVRKFLRKRLLFKKQKVDSTGYYGIEDPFPDLISKLRRFTELKLQIITLIYFFIVAESLFKSYW